MIWLQIGYVLVMGIFAIYYIRMLPGLLELGRMWNRFGDHIERSTELNKEGVRYLKEGCPRNATACFRSAVQNLDEAGRILGHDDHKM